MQPVKKFFKSFTLAEALIWSVSVLAIILSFVLTGNTDYLQLTASLVGTCCLLLTAKGNVLGQIFSVAFAVFYGTISFFYAYYGETIICLCMSTPIAIAAIVTWLRNPFRGDKAEVTVNRLSIREHIILILISVLVSIVFHFILRALNTANLWWSTVSVLTSCLAILLTMRRSPHYALAYAFNDAVLIVLWTLAAADNREYIAMIVCFAVFLFNDLYGLINWLRMRKKQTDTTP